MDNIDVVVPLFGDVQLGTPLINCLSSDPIIKEMRQLGCSLTVITNDGRKNYVDPIPQNVLTKLGAALPYLSVRATRQVKMSQLLNKALIAAGEKDRDLIILCASATLSNNTFTEMKEVSYLDGMIGFVRPRSNRSSICSLPHGGHFVASLSQSEAAFRQLSVHLPRFQFIPPGSGPCLLIKADILREFALRGESLSGAKFTLREMHQSTGDLIMRANRCGYRVALANRAWIADTSEDENDDEASMKVLNERYPEYEPSLRRYFSGERYEAELMLSTMVPDDAGRVDLLLDLSSMGPHHNGTFTFCKEILSRAAKGWTEFNLYVMISDEARRFHELDRFEGIQFVSLDVQRTFGVGLRLGQPFTVTHLTRLSRLAAVNIYAMLDPIVFDCQYMNTGGSDDIESLWTSVFSYADGVIYISEFVRELFWNRFERRRGLRELVAYPSLDLNEYRGTCESAAGNPEHILVFGNNSDHKRVRITVEALGEAFPSERIVAFGARIEGLQNVAWFESGSLGEPEVRNLISRSRVVIYPSTYEGFGLPILESLACQKPVMARSLPVTRIIRERITCPENLELFFSTSDLVARLSRGLPTWRYGMGRDSESIHNWEEVVGDMGAFISTCLHTTVIDSVLIPRIRYMHLLGQRAQATGDLIPTFGTPKEEIQLIYSSWSWRLTAPLRWIGSKCLRLRELSATSFRKPSRAKR